MVYTCMWEWVRLCMQQQKYNYILVKLKILEENKYIHM